MTSDSMPELPEGASFIAGDGARSYAASQMPTKGLCIIPAADGEAWAQIVALTKTENKGPADTVKAVVASLGGAPEWVDKAMELARQCAQDSREGALLELRILGWEELRAHLSTRVVAPGWQLVPIEPTPEMLEATGIEDTEYYFHSLEGAHDFVATHYRAMLSASPLHGAANARKPEADLQLMRRCLETLRAIVKKLNETNTAQGREFVNVGMSTVALMDDLSARMEQTP